MNDTPILTAFDIILYKEITLHEEIILYKEIMDMHTLYFYFYIFV